MEREDRQLIILTGLVMMDYKSENIPADNVACQPANIHTRNICGRLEVRRMIYLKIYYMTQFSPVYLPKFEPK